MNTFIEHFTVIAESATGFWLTLPVPTGTRVSREEWMRLHQSDPAHFQLIEIPPDAELPVRPIAHEDAVEHALSVIWLDELFSRTRQ